MSPFLDALVADEIVRGRQKAELADFRTARFSIWREDAYWSIRRRR